MPFKPGKSYTDANNKLDAWTKELQVKAKDACYMTAWKLGTASDYFVPMDTGDLMQSKEVTTPVREGGVWSVTLSYGGDHTAAYAGWLYYNDNWSPRGPDASGKRGALTNPNAKSRWIEHGLQTINLNEVFREEMSK